LRLALRGGVDCWIGVVDQAAGRLVRLAGRLSVAQVPELLESCADTASLQIDLSDLISVDVPGLETLQRLRKGGATLIGTPGYLQLKLDSHVGATVGSLPRKDKSRGFER